MNTVLKFDSKLKIMNHYQYDAVTEQTELMWRCSLCGELIHRKDGLPENCPSCGAPRKDFALIEED